MKRLLLFFLTVLLLAGCSAKPSPTETTAGTTATQQTEPSDLYVPDTSIEQLTGGAVRAYPLSAEHYIGLYPMGTNLLLVGQGELLVLSGDQGTQIAKLATDEKSTVSVMDTAVTGMAYYLPDTRQVMILNPQLQSTAQLQLPENVMGTPVISLARNEVYYSTGKEIRALHMQTGISRLLRQQSSSTQNLLGTYFDGTVLACQIIDENGKEQVSYISAVTGQTVSNENSIFEMQTYGENYLLQRMDGILHQTIFGARKGQPQCFLAPLPTGDYQSGRVGLLEINGILDYVETDSGLELSFYELETGKHTAKVTLPGIHSPVAFHSDGTYIWILAEDGTNTHQTLYRWEIAKSSVQDDTINIGPLYTAENPNAQCLAQCRTQADTLEEKHKVTLAIWNDAGTNTGGYTVATEYHPEVISAMLSRLETALSRFPENFLTKTVDGNRIRIALVRSIENDQPWVQYWHDGKCHIILSSEGDAAQSLYQGVAYAIDSHVLGNSRDFDTWNQLNPQGFAYAYSYQVPEQPQYLEGENRAFTELLAMSYPHEDRCRVFYHAMLENNADMFKSATMQAKLLRICKGIREAYGLEKSTSTYAWEQYLNESIAYKR